MPEVGKSTPFNAVSSKQAEAVNYPFCTIDPNVGVVPVPDPRFDALVRSYDPESRVPARCEVVCAAIEAQVMQLPPRTAPSSCSRSTRTSSAASYVVRDGDAMHFRFNV